MESLYLCCVSTVTSSSSYLVLIQFWRGILTSLLPLATLCSFIFFVSLEEFVTRKYIFLNCSMLNMRHTCLRLLFTPQNIHHYLNDWTCYIAGILHQCICTSQHTPGDGSFYFVCITEPTFNTVVALQYMSYVP